VNYWNLVAAHRRLLSFGFALTFFSSFGQTFFIAVFGAELRTEFGLTHGSFGALYSAATLASGICLIWLGSAIDRMSLRRYTRIVVVGMVLGCAFFGTVSNVVALGLGVFALRLFGQGLMGHTAMTTMARYFTTTRGKAMSIAALGFPAGEALFPRAFVSVKSALGWRASWWAIAVGLALVLVPSVERLLRRDVRGRFAEPGGGEDAAVSSGLRGDSAGRQGVPEPHDGPGGRRGVAGGTDPSVGRQWSRKEVLRDPRFHLVLPAVMAPPFIVTGLFFHQVALVGAKGWTLEFFTACFAVFASAQLVSSLSAGPVVDRLGAWRLLPVYLIPLGAALAILALGTGPLVVVGFMATAGLSGGAQATIVGSYWAEVYGVRHLGAIRATVMSIMVFSTAAAPVLLGRLLDRGVTFETIAWLCLAYVVGGSLLAGVGERRPGIVRDGDSCRVESASPVRSLR